MRELVPILGAALLLLCFAGAVTLSLLPNGWRAILLPALPAVGAMTLAVVLNATTVVLPTSQAIWWVIGAGVIVLAVRARWVHWWEIDHRTVVVAGVAMFLGVIPLYLAIAPARAHGAEVVQVTLNNDAFAYVSVASWLKDHPATSPPRVGIDPPADAYAAFHLDDGLRIGDELVQAAIAEVTGHDAEQNWYAVTCLSLLLLPGSVAAAFRAMHLRSWTGLATGLLASVTFLVTFQVFNSNSDSLLGMAIAPLGIALVATRIAPPDSERPPVWLAAGALSALAATYTEYLPVVALGWLVFAVARTPRAWLRTGLDGAVMVLMAAAIAPRVGYDAQRSLRTDAGAAVGLSSSFSNVNPAAFLERALGLVGMDGAGHLAIALAIGAVLGALFIIGVVGLPHWRWLIAGLIANMAALTIHFSGSHGYSEARVIEMSLPLALVLAGFGADVLITWVSAPRPRVMRFSALAVVAPAALVMAGMNISTARQVMASPAIAHRSVTSDFTEVTAWVKEYAGARGGGIAVLDEDFFDQLWALHATRAYPDVAYPFLFADYALETSFKWHPTQHPPRWLIVGTREVVDAGPGVVIASNPRFRLLDLERGSALVVLPTPPAWAGSDAKVANWIGDGAGLITIRTSDVRSMRFTVQTAIPAHASTAMAMLSGGVSLWTGPAPANQAASTMMMPAATTIVELSLQRVGAGPPRPVDPNAPPPFWIQIGNIGRG